MNVFKLLLCDIREGIFRNKRFIIVPFLCIFECLYASMNINAYKGYYEIYSKTTFLDLMTEIFHGCDPIAKNPNPDIKIEIPYFWLAVFIFAVFIGFDYMRNDLTQFGIQVLSRIQKRSKWWLAKCVWCLMSGVWFYVLFLLTALIFCIINGYGFGFTGNLEIINVLANRSVIYTYIGISELNIFQGVSILIAPIFVICTLNMIQMILCLFLKPMYSYLIIIGVLLFGILTDIPIAFSRCGMLTFSNCFFQDGYQTELGFVICLTLITGSILIGNLYFRRYDILPDKE